MVQLFVVWDRTPESELFQKISKAGGFIQLNSVSAEHFLQDPQIPDSCDAVLLIGSVADRAFYSAAQVLRKQCRKCPLILSTTEEGTGFPTEVKTKTGTSEWNFWADLWIIRKTDDDGTTGAFGQKLLLLLSRMQGECGELFSKFKSIADHANYGIAISDLTGTLLYVNHWFADLHGYEESELTGKNIDALYRFQSAEFADIKQRLFEQKHLELEERNAIRKDGSTFPTRANLQVLSDNDGTPLFVSGIVVDITEQKKAEEELEITRYSIENANDGVYWILPDGRFFNVNTEACRMLGYTRKELLERSLFDVAPEFTKDSWETDWQNLRETGKIRRETIHRRKDGSTYPVEVSVNYLKYKDSEYNCAFVRDITARKQAEEALRASEEQLRLKLNSILSPDYDIEEEEFSNIIDRDAIQSLMDEFYQLTNIGIAISDRKGNILVATGWQDICTNFHLKNPETKKNCSESDLALTTGISPGEVRYNKCKNNMWDSVTPIYIGGKHMGNLFLGQFFYDDEEVDRRIFAEQADRYGFDKEAYLAALDRVPRWSRDKVQTAMVFYQKFARMISDLSYSNLKLATLLADNKKTEEQLRLSEQKYRSYIDNSPDGVFVADANGHYLEVNQAACDLLGYTEDELLAMNITQIVPPENTEMVLEHFRELQKTGRVHVELFLRKKDGSFCTVNVGAVVLPNGTALGFTTDLTESKQAEERILHLNRLLGAIRNVNQLIVQENDPRTLIEKTCNALTGVGGYHYVWIALFDRDGAIQSVAESALADVFPPMYDYLMGGSLPACAKKAMATHEVVVTTDPSTTCSGCPLAGSYGESSGLAKSIESNGTVYGIISTSVSRDLAIDPEEQELFAEVAGDLGFALYSIDLEEKRRNAETEILEKNRRLEAAYRDLAASEEHLRENLKELVASQQEVQESERRLSQIIEFLPDATFAIDTDGKVIAWNKAIETMTGIYASEMLGKGDYEYSLRIYGSRKPVLIDYILNKELKDIIDSPSWHEEGDTLVSEKFVPSLFGNRGAYIWLTASRLYDTEGNLTGAIESIRDITSAKEAEKQILSTTHDLQERVKELTCLREVSDIIFTIPSEEELFSGLLPLIQAAMQYPEDTGVAVQTDDATYQTEHFPNTGPEIEQTIFVDDSMVGTITVRYLHNHPEGNDHPFLPEEVSLLRIISENTGNYLSRRLTENRFRESEKRFRELFNNMSSGVAVYEVVGDGRDFIFRDFNKAAEVIDNVRREDVIGKSIFEAFPGVEAFGLLAVLRRVYTTGKPEHFPLSEYKDSRIRVWRENYVYRLPSGEIVSVYDDVTEKKQATAALSESEYKYHEIFNNIDEAVFLHEVLTDNTRGKFIEVNDVACRRLGYSREELLKMNVADINTPQVRKDDPARVLALQAGKPISFDGEHVRKDGSIFPVHVNARMITLQGHQYILSLVRDLTEEREAKEREAIALRQIEENLTQLAILNDEIRNPLAVITGIVDFCEKDVATPVLEQIHSINDIVTRLDQGWLESDKIREYLRKHHDIT